MLFVHEQITTPYSVHCRIGLSILNVLPNWLIPGNDRSRVLSSCEHLLNQILQSTYPAEFWAVWLSVPEFNVHFMSPHQCCVNAF